MLGANLAREADPAPLHAVRAPDPPRPPRFGMSAHLFLLTIAFVALAEVLIYVPSVASFRRGWIVNRVEAACVAMLALDAAPGGQIPESLSHRLLEGAGVRSVAAGEPSSPRRLSRHVGATEIADNVDLGTKTWIDSVRGAWRTLFAPIHAPIRVVAPAREGREGIEILVDEAPLRAAMLAHSFQLLLSSLIVAAAAAGLVFLTLQRLIVGRVQRLVRNITAFADDQSAPIACCSRRRAATRLGRRNRRSRGWRPPWAASSGSGAVWPNSASRSRRSTMSCATS